MTIHLRWGGATDVGQLRSVNQDSMLLGPDVFVVADGMGGHQGGEVASALAIEAIEAVADRLPGGSVRQLITAVQDANDSVLERGAQDPALAGMGTTLVAIAAVVEDGEERLAVVNVGDSRAYRLSGGQLEQITDDHSLVAELVRDGRISEEEAAVHPQRNIVTRALGQDENIPVDVFQILPHAGDRYLLCSDGLTNEVEERDIAAVLRTTDDPSVAADELVRRANEHGGRDNITIVIVDVVDDGGVSESASAAVPTGGTVDGHRDDATEAILAVPDDQAHEQKRSSAGGTAPATERRPPTSATEGSEGPDRPRLVTLRSVAFVVVVLAVIGAGLYLVNDYATNTYFVTIDDGEVAIFQGRPGGVLWIDPSLVDTVGIPEDEVPDEVVDDLREGVDRPSLESARRYVANLEERIEEIRPPATTTTTTTSTSTTTAPTTTAAP